MTISSSGGGYSSSKSKKRRKGHEASGEIVNNLIIIILFSIPIAFIFSASVMRVRLTAETQNMNKRVNEMQKEMHNFDREIRNYNLKIEKSSGKSILMKVKQMNLNLEYARPGHIMRLKYPREPELQAVTPKKSKDITKL